MMVKPYNLSDYPTGNSKDSGTNKTAVDSMCHPDRFHTLQLNLITSKGFCSVDKETKRFSTMKSNVPYN